MINFRISKIVGIAVLFPFLQSGIVHTTSSALTYRFDGSGRFGDCVMIYCKALYCAHLYDLPFLYKSFRSSEQLQLNRNGTLLNHNDELEHPNSRLISTAEEIDPQLNNTLFITDLFTMLSGKQPTDPRIETIPVPDWMNFWPDEIYTMMKANPTYQQKIKTALQPIKAGEQLTPPIGSISVAVHVRKGGSVDLPLSSPQLYDSDHPELYESPYLDTRASDRKFPLRFCPEQFYVDQLNQLATMVAPQDLFVLLFTDDNNPHALLSRFQQACPAANIHFGGIFRSAHFIDDLSLMAQTDCLIRPCSHFSGVAQLMGNHTLIIRPQYYVWHEPLLLITGTSFIINKGDSSVPYIISQTGSAELRASLSGLFKHLLIQEIVRTDELRTDVAESTPHNALEYSIPNITSRKNATLSNQNKLWFINNLLVLLNTMQAHDPTETTLQNLDDESETQQNRESFFKSELIVTFSEPLHVSDIRRDV